MQKEKILIMESVSTFKYHWIIILLMIIPYFCFAQTHDKKSELEPINKYFKRDLNEKLFLKMINLNKKLAIETTALRDIDRDKDIWVIRTEGNHEPFPLTIDTKWDDEMPKWSPDDQFIAYVSNKSGVKKIWIMKADGTNKKQITRGTIPDIDPLWAPNGQLLAFIRYENIYITDLTNQIEQQITTNLNVEKLCSWSRDGNTILFVTKDQNNQLKLAEIDLSTKVVNNSTFASELHSLWSKLHLSPMKDVVAFERFDHDNFDIAIEDLNNGQRRNITKSFSHDRQPEWSSKGDKLVFSSNRKTPTINQLNW